MANQRPTVGGLRALTTPGDRMNIKDILSGQPGTGLTKKEKKKLGKKIGIPISMRKKPKRRMRA